MSLWPLFYRTNMTREKIKDCPDYTFPLWGGHVPPATAQPRLGRVPLLALQFEINETIFKGEC